MEHRPQRERRRSNAKYYGPERRKKFSPLIRQLKDGVICAESLLYALSLNVEPKKVLTVHVLIVSTSNKRGNFCGSGG